MDKILQKGLLICTLLSTIHGLSDIGEIEVGTKRMILKKNCCENKGICVLGTLCKCRKNYFGRRCEFKVEFKPCGAIPHGSWIKADCNLCKCFDGDMSCIPRVYDGCGYEGKILDYTATTKDPLLSDDIEIVGNDRDYQDKQQLPDYNYEDYYYTNDENSASSNFDICTLGIYTVVLALAFVLT